MERITEKERKLIAQIIAISEKGNSAEVKRNQDGNYVVYEVKKRKTVVE